MIMNDDNDWDWEVSLTQILLSHVFEAPTLILLLNDLGKINSNKELKVKETCIEAQ